MRGIFLDRDGTINADKGFVHRVEDFEFIEGVLPAVRKLSKHFKIFIVTNQSGVGTERYTLREMHLVHEHMLRQFYLNGATIEGVAYCPHATHIGCGCRKPELGMLVQLEQRHGKVDYGESWLVGDKLSDIMMGQRAGMKTALIRSQYWDDEILGKSTWPIKGHPPRPDMTVDSLRDFTDRIINDV
jgi:D-glycero-D-manno-heptose 1,7-bisphosphate phosphatase